MSEVENREQTGNNSMDIGGSPAQRVPAPGMDPFGGDDSDEITIIGGRPEPRTDPKRTQQSDLMKITLTLDDLLSDICTTNDTDGQLLEAQTSYNRRSHSHRTTEPKKDFKAAINDYGMQV